MLIERYAFSFRLRALDALQLAVALALRSEKLADYFIAADPVLCEVAALEGFAVVRAAPTPTTPATSISASEVAGTSGKPASSPALSTPRISARQWRMSNAIRCGREWLPNSAALSELSAWRREYDPKRWREVLETSIGEEALGQRIH